MAVRLGTYDATSHRGDERQLGANGEWREKDRTGSTRSDDRIRDDIRDQLSGEPQLAASNIEVQVEGGEVTLTGAVPDRWALGRAEALAQRVGGVRNVRNALRIELHGVGTTGNSVGEKPKS